MSETYDNKAVNGKELAEQTLVGVASEIKREGYVSAAAFNEVVARLVALEKAMAEQNIGDRTADAIDAQSLKVGGVDVTTATDHTVTFSQATSKADITSESTLSNLFGKIKKWYNSFGSLAWKSSVSTSDIDDDAVTAAKVKDNETLPVSISGRSEYLLVTRINESADLDDYISNNDCRVLEVNGAVVSHCPGTSWYHVYTTRGPDAGYACQFAVGMTTPGVWSRRKDNGQWTSWETSVFSGDSRLLPDSDVLIAVYTTQASGTTLEELRTAYHAGKKIYVKIGGSIGNDSYEELIPLSYVRNSVVNNESVIVGFYFESQIDPVINEGQAGTMTTYYRNSSGWSYKTGSVQYAEASGESNQANYAKGYVEGEGIAQGLASKMSITADNASVGALQNLCGQISTNILTDLVDGSDIITSYPGPDGMSTQGHVNQLYASKALRVYNYIKSKLVSQKDVATPPRLALLDSPKYYWKKPNGEVVTSYVRVVDATKSSSSYYNLGNEVNTSTRWGVCHVPNFGTLAGTYVEIDFDIALSSYYIDSGWLIGNPYANLDLPYIMKFVAATKSNDGDAVISIPTSSNTIFASTTLSIDCMRGNTKSFGHVHMSGRIGASTASNEAIFICALGYYGMDNVAVLAEMGNVRVKATNDDKGMT